MDGNRRYAKKNSLLDEDSYRTAFTSLLYLCKYCSELGIKYLTVFVFSIDNFKRKPEEVNCVMDIIMEKTQEMLEEESFVKRYGIRIIFVGNLRLLSEPTRLAAERAMAATKGNSRMVISVCVAYSSSNEIVNAVENSCKSYTLSMPDLRPAINVEDVEKHLFTASVPDPCILIRTSGEQRLSDFLLWQTSNCLLYSPAVLWSEIGIRQFAWAIIKYQRLLPYLFYLVY